MRGLLSIFLILSFFISSFAQVGINEPSPDDNSVLDLNSGNNKGLLIPRMTSNNREAMSSGSGFSQGMMVYDTDLDILFVGYGNGASGNTKWYSMNPWKTEYRKGNNGDTANMTAMTVNPNATVGNSGIHYGNVGIGIPVPTEKLHVAGKVKATEFIGNGTTPLGGIIMWSGSTAPSGWALCNGGTVNGYKTPNLKGRFVVGYDNRVADYNNPGNLSTKGAGLSNAGGEKEVALTINQMPRHDHGGSTNYNGSHSHGLSLGYEGDDKGTGGSYDEYTKTTTRFSTVTTQSAGSHKHSINAEGGNPAVYSGPFWNRKLVSAVYTSAHENRPPYYTLAYIMRVY